MTIFPKKITAGVTFRHVISLTAYPASQGWHVAVYLRGKGSIDLVSIAQHNQHILSADANTTKNWVGGHYGYSVRLIRDDEVVEMDSGSVEIKADIASVVADTDFRSHARKVLDAIEAVLENRASLDQERYRINNRELYRTPIETLKKMRDQYRAEVSREEAKANGKNIFGQKIRFRLD